MSRVGFSLEELSKHALPRLATGIDGFDELCEGGVPEGRVALLSGGAGAGKTVFAMHFVSAGLLIGEPGIFVTFEESAKDIRKNMRGLGWDLEMWERDGKFAIVDASPNPTEEDAELGSFDLGGLLARIERAVQRTGANRVAIDSIGSLTDRFTNERLIRRELLRLARALQGLGVTTVMTAERDDGDRSISRFGVEQFVADSVVILRNAISSGRRRRTLEILKMRGANHRRGRYPFTIVPGEGIIVIPIQLLALEQKSTDSRITSGVETLDEMYGGGLLRDSVIIVSGATGTGKTLMVSEFVNGGAVNGERALVCAFEESRDQLVRNADGWGKNFSELEDQGLLKIATEYPEARAIEDHLLRIRNIVDEFEPQRLALDSLSALERSAKGEGFREFVMALTSFLKERQIATMFTSTSSDLLGGSSVTEAHLSTLTDSIVLLRYVELRGEVRRGITVLKMRGSEHDKRIREFTIDGHGMHVGEPFRDVSGILAGLPRQSTGDEINRIGAMFES